MKRTLIALLSIVAVSGAVFAAPLGQGRRGMRHDGPRPGMLFKFVESVRSDLNLNQEQNKKLDALINEVKDFRKTQLQGQGKQQKDDMLEAFVSESFNAESIHAERQKMMEQKRDTIQKFMTQKIQALHDLLTKEQRQKLVDLMKEKRQERMSRRGDRPMGRGMRMPRD